MATLQEIFNAVVLEEQTLTVNTSKREYESLRVALVRKFSNYRTQCQLVGISSYDDRYVQCSFDKAVQEASFRIAWREDSKRTPKDYLIYKL